MSRRSADDRRRQEIFKEAIQRALDRRSPGEVVLDAAPAIRRARDEVLMSMDIDWESDEDFQDLEYAERKATDRVIREALADAGYDLSEEEWTLQVYEFEDIVEMIVEQAEEYEYQRKYGDLERAYDGDPEYREAWEQVYRPELSTSRAWYRRLPTQLLPHGQHRRAPGRRPIRRQGSRRASGLRSGQDPGGDPDPADLPDVSGDRRRINRGTAV